MKIYDYLSKLILILFVFTPLCAYSFDGARVEVYWFSIVSLGLFFIFLFYRYAAIEKYSRNLQKNINIIDEHVLISYSDRDGNITGVSEALCRLTGYSKDELIGKNHRIFKHPDTPKEFYSEFWDTISRGDTFKGEIQNMTKNGSSYWIDATVTPFVNKKGEIEGYSAIRQDITDKKYAQKLSITDPLTQIYNRLYLKNIFTLEIQKARRYGNIYSVIIMDVDFFKAVNDTHGHNVGDMVLIDLVKILKLNLRESDILGRWGGEEFLIVCSNSSVNQAYTVAEKLRVVIEKHYFDVVGNITCSFGVSEYKEGDENSEETVKRADDALYLSKDSGRNRVTLE